MKFHLILLALLGASSLFGAETSAFKSKPAQSEAILNAQSDIENVISQLESIDTLSQMQNKRNSYTASGHYDINTTNASVISKHEKARAGYETYVADMFEKRKAAQKAYDELSAEQKAQIPDELVAKLSNELPTVFKTATYSLTPRDDEYAFETVNGGAGYGYEVSNHMISGEIPQTFILVDVSDGATSWPRTEDMFTVRAIMILLIAVTLKHL